MARLQRWVLLLVAAVSLVVLPAPSARAEMPGLVELINAERARAGVAPVTVDPLLAQAAQLKAQDMIERGYFGHNSPAYGTPGQLVRALGAPFGHVAENLASGTDIAAAHAQLMGSPSHRHNLLNPEFTAVGVAVVPGGPYGAMMVELFAAER